MATLQTGILLSNWPLTSQSAVTFISAQLLVCLFSFGFSWILFPSVSSRKAVSAVVCRIDFDYKQSNVVTVYDHQILSDLLKKIAQVKSKLLFILIIQIGVMINFLGDL